MPAERHICFSAFRAVGQDPKPAHLERHRLPATLDSFLQLLLSLSVAFFSSFSFFHSPPTSPPSPVGLFWVFEGVFFLFHFFLNIFLFCVLFVAFILFLYFMYTS